MNKRTIRDRISEILEKSETDISTWDPEVRDELAEDLATAMAKLEMEEIFDSEYPEDDTDDMDV